jgi:hypothetical protein
MSSCGIFLYFSSDFFSSISRTTTFHACSLANYIGLKKNLRRLCNQTPRHDDLCESGVKTSWSYSIEINLFTGRFPLHFKAEN